MRRSAAVAAVLVLLAACTGKDRVAGSLTACADLVPNCHATRLPDVTLRGHETSGALQPVDGLNLTGIICFDEALCRAGVEDGHPEARTVQVTLGSADANTNHWGHGRNLYFAIDWGGVCQVSIGGGRIRPSPVPTETCYETTWGTVIDAHTGAFIVGGS